MTKRRFLFPLKLGILIGGIAGLCNSGKIIQRGYLHYHLYNTAFKLLRTETDRSVLFDVAVLYAIWLAYQLLYVIVGSRLKGKTRTSYRVIIACAAVVGASLHLGVISWFQQFDSLFFQTAYAQSKWQILAAGVCFLLGALYLVRLRISSREVRPANASNVTLSCFTRGARSIFLRVEDHTAIYACAIILVLALNTAAIYFQTEVAVSAPKKPNIIIIMDDTLRADHVGCYGYSRKITPNIDRLASGSIRFSQAIANSSWTTASVASFMTSQYPQTAMRRMPHSMGYSDMPPKMSTRVVTIAEALRDQGYTTGAVISNPQFGSDRNGSKGFNFFDESATRKEISSPTVVSVAEKWLKTNHNKRFFLFALFLDCHSPYRTHPGFNFDPGYTGKCANEIGLSSTDTLSTVKCPLSHIQALYDSGVAYSDYYIGSLIEDLKKQGLYNNSIIVFLADHGDQLADHGGFFHGNTLYHELVHVPLLIKLPDQTQGRVVNGDFPLVDLFPTILGTIGSDPSTIHPQGKAVDLRSVKEMRDEYIFGATSLYDKLRSVQNRDYKYILDIQKHTGMLFNLRTDPLEQRNIAADNPTIAAALNKVLLAKESELNTAQSDTSTHSQKPITEVERQKLRSLGYMQ